MLRMLRKFATIKINITKPQITYFKFDIDNQEKKDLFELQARIKVKIQLKEDQENQQIGDWQQKQIILTGKIKLNDEDQRE